MNFMSRLASHLPAGEKQRLIAGNLIPKRVAARLAPEPARIPPETIAPDASEYLHRFQASFDVHYRIFETIMEKAATDSSIVMTDSAPYHHVAMIVNALSHERFKLGEVVVVDTTDRCAQTGVSDEFVVSCRQSCPGTVFKLIPYMGQDVKFPAAITQGIQKSSGGILWVVGQNQEPRPHCFEYLLKLYLIHNCEFAVATTSLLPDGRILSAAAPQAIIYPANPSAALRGDSLPQCPVDFLDLPDDVGGSRLSGFAYSFWSGIYGGRRNILVQANSGRIFDPAYITGMCALDLSRQLTFAGHGIVYGLPAATFGADTHFRIPAQDWEVLHDWRLLLDKERGAVRGDASRIELVCPFHRGDITIATQVARQAIRSGQSLRLHVAEGMVNWVRAIDPDLDVQPIPVPFLSGGETYPILLRSYAHVAQRLDSTAHIRRCHPSRGLSETGMNLVEYMLSEVGLPTDTLIQNATMEPTEAMEAIAADLLQEHGQDIVFLHPFGGWDLKTVPAALLPVIASGVSAAGFKLIQVGGAADRNLNMCDGAILENFLPDQWYAIFKRGRAVIGVDSWITHFASILDMPQVALYGSTNPLHVKSKQYFSRQASEFLCLGPVVACSPCNSFACRIKPELNYCEGYFDDFDKFTSFLQRLPQQWHAGRST